MSSIAQEKLIVNDAVYVCVDTKGGEWEKGRICVFIVYAHTMSMKL